MLDVGTLRIKIEADSDKAKQNIKNVGDEAQRTEEKTQKASRNIEAATQDVQNAFGGLATGVKVATAATAAAFTALATSAVGSFARFEQNLGGINKLFGDSANQVAQDAKEAFITCQTSANDYMEQVTSFSASLIGSLGGDTAAAASYAKQAMMDMSDNANTFGTNIEDIQHAYQGFAKSNFTMLDNLKLGYGGTKEEMERLIQDANRVKEANGEMADLSIDSFADMVEAIHIIQEQMNIAGTTEKEALTTIEGSINATKAAWENWITGLSDSEADMSQLTKQLVDMFVNTFKLIVPRVKEILTTVIEQIPEIFNQLYSTLPAQVQGIIDIFAALLPAIIGIVGGIVAVVEGIKIADTIGTIAKGFQGLWTVLAANPIGAVIAIIAALAAAFMTAYATNEEFRNKVNEVWSEIQPIIQGAIDAILPILSSFGEVIATSVIPVISSFVELFTAFCSAVAPLIMAALTQIQDIFAQVFPYIQTIVSSVFGIIQSVITTVMGVIQGVIMVALGIIQGNWSGVWDGIKQIASSVWNGIQGVISNGINLVKSVIATALGIIQGTWSNAWNAVKDFLSNAMDGIKNAVSNGIDRVVEFFSNLPSNILSALGDVGGILVNAGSQIISGFLNGLKSKFEEVKGFVSGIGDWIAAHKGPKAYDLALLIPNGGWIMKSLATGLAKSMPLIKDVLDDTAKSIAGYDFGTATIQADFNAYKRVTGLDSNSKKNTGGNSNTANIVVNNYSPKSLTEKESAREFRKSIRGMAFA